MACYESALSSRISCWKPATIPFCYSATLFPPLPSGNTNYFLCFVNRQVGMGDTELALIVERKDFTSCLIVERRGSNYIALDFRMQGIESLLSSNKIDLTNHMITPEVLNSTDAGSNCQVIPPIMICDV